MTATAVQFFLRTAESGEGADRERALEDPSMDLVIADRQRLLFEEASTEVELLAENPAVLGALLLAVRDWRLFELSPEINPRLRWYDPPWQRGERRTRPMPRPLEVPEDEVPRFRTAVLRTSVRCLRLMMLCADGREQLEAAGGPELLNRAALDNPLDDFVQNDVKAIFSAVYGGENAVRRIALSGVPTVVEMMHENRDSAIVQLAGVRRMCHLLAGDAKDAAVVIVPAAESPKRHDQANALPQDVPKEARSVAKGNNDENVELFEELDKFGAVVLAVETLARFDVDQYLALYVHVSRFIAYVAVKGECTNTPTHHSPRSRQLIHPAYCRAERQGRRASGRRPGLYQAALPSARAAARQEGARESGGGAARSTGSAGAQRVVWHPRREQALVRLVRCAAGRAVSTAAAVPALHRRRGKRHGRVGGRGARGGRLYAGGSRTASHLGARPARQARLQRVHDEAAQAQVLAGGDPPGPGRQ